MSQTPRLDSETAVAGSILIDPKCLPAVRKIIGPEHFTVDWCWAVFQAACALEDEGRPVDIILIREKAREMGQTLETDTLLQAMDVTPTAANAEEYAKLLKEPPAPTSNTARPRAAKSAADFQDANTKFLWYPYLPIGDYSVMMADGGTGKTILCCGIASVLSNGELFPGEAFLREPKDTLIISAEDTGEVLKSRLQKSGADLNRIKIIDCMSSVGMSISDGYDEFVSTIREYAPGLVIIDPWHAFLGEHVDISRTNALRPHLQKLANITKQCECAMILVSHVNKRAQGENANNAATGSTDFINAARSAFRVIFDEEDEDCRIMVHTKTNYAPYGPSVKYKIDEGGVVWLGFSEITRQTLEKAARKHSTPQETLTGAKKAVATNSALIEALKASANPFVTARYSYDEFKAKHGEFIFGGQQPKRALDAVAGEMLEQGYFVKTCDVRRDGKHQNGLLIQQLGVEPERVTIKEASP